MPESDRCDLEPRDPKCDLFHATSVRDALRWLNQERLSRDRRCALARGPVSRSVHAMPSTNPDVVTVLPGARRMARRMPLPSNGAMDLDDMEQDAALGVLTRRAPSTAAAAPASRRSPTCGHAARCWTANARWITCRGRGGARSARWSARAPRWWPSSAAFPQPEELAERLSISTQELRDIDERCRFPTNLNEPLAGQRSREEPLTVADGIMDDQPLPDESAEAHEEARRLHAAIARLPTREAFTIRATSFMGMKTGEVADLLGISRSRVSQLRTAAMRRLPELLEQVDADTTLARAA